MGFSGLNENRLGGEGEQGLVGWVWLGLGEVGCLGFFGFSLQKNEEEEECTYLKSQM